MSGGTSTRCHTQTGTRRATTRAPPDTIPSAIATARRPAATGVTAAAAITAIATSAANTHPTTVVVANRLEAVCHETISTRAAWSNDGSARAATNDAAAKANAAVANGGLALLAGASMDIAFHECDSVV